MVQYGVAETVAEVGRTDVKAALTVRRITAPNPSPMTHEGTQTYLIESAGRALVLDAGPAIDAHLEAILRALGPVRIEAQLVTHSHRDHSPGARALAAETGTPVLALGPHGAGMSAQMQALAEAGGGSLGGGEGADREFQPDRRIGDGEAIALGDWQITALHTPGHLSNHLSFHIEGSGVLFSGDAVMGISTTLVSPPEGDMAAQVATLERLAALVSARAAAGEALRFLPGHGPEVTDPGALLAGQLAHRRARRDALVAALAEGPASAPLLAARLYVGTPPSLLPAA
ncbi:MAG: MBL fold metallo-hydrolase, partial [Pseudomonadota bacterium]